MLVLKKLSTANLILSLWLMLIGSFQSIQAQETCQEFFELGNITAIEEDETFLYLGMENSQLLLFNKADETHEVFELPFSGGLSPAVTDMLFYNSLLYISSNKHLFTFDGTGFTEISDSLGGIMIENSDGNIMSMGAGAVYGLESILAISQTDLSLIDGVNLDCCEFPTDVTKDASGNLWFTRYAFYEFDILKYDGSVWSVFNGQNTSIFPVESYLPNGIASNSDVIYATAFDGILKYEDGEWSDANINWDDMFFPGAGIESDESGVIWIGSISGTVGDQEATLAYLYNNVWTVLPPITGHTDHVVKVHPSSFDASRIYAGSASGLIVVDKSCLSLSTTDVDENLQSQITIYPNPSADFLAIVLPENLELFELEMSDIEGRKVRLVAMDEDKIDVSHLSKGVYFLHIYTNAGKAVKRLVIE